MVLSTETIDESGKAICFCERFGLVFGWLRVTWFRRIVQRKNLNMITQLAIAPLVALIAGILILIAPRLLNYVVALYLIIIGVLGLFPNLLS